jgi:hypothetical protein
MPKIPGISALMHSETYHLSITPHDILADFVSWCSRKSIKNVCAFMEAEWELRRLERMMPWMQSYLKIPTASFEAASLDTLVHSIVYLVFYCILIRDVPSTCTGKMLPNFLYTYCTLVHSIVYLVFYCILIRDVPSTCTGKMLPNFLYTYCTLVHSIVYLVFYCILIRDVPSTCTGKMLPNFL